MKITDLRTSRVFVGEHVATIAGNSQPTDEQLQEFLNIWPEDMQYAAHKRPMTHKRYVLQYAPGKYFVITANTKIFKVEP